MTRAVSVLEVSEPAIWDELSARLPLEAHLGERLGPTRCVVLPSFEKEILPRLAEQGAPVLVRYARRSAAAVAQSTTEIADRAAGLPRHARDLLRAAQHHAIDGVVVGRQAWDPENDAPSVRALHGAGLLELVPGDEAFTGRYRLNPDLPPPLPIPYDFSDAVMEETEDLEAPGHRPVALLHDLASLAAAIAFVRPARTHTGTIAKADAKRLMARLGTRAGIEEDERWARALRGLEALRVVSTDPLTRALDLDLGLEATLAGDTPDAVDHLVRRMVEPDLHGVIPAIREALRQAGDGAVDELVLLDLLREQHRELLFPIWRRDGAEVYPVLGDETPRPFDDTGWERVETRMIRALIGRLARLGVVRRAPGVIAATPDGRIWARVRTSAPPPVWVSSDLEIMVPPDAVTPWERFQLERLGRCLARDVVDRYRLERRSFEAWLATHELDEALALLRRRAPAVPTTVEDALRGWARSATRVVLTRGVLI